MSSPKSARHLKDPLSLKEMKFLEIYFLGGLNMDQAMISAGYVGYHPKSLYRLGRKIVEKFENQAGDHRKIFRAIGAGEVTIIRGLLEIAQDPKVTAAVRLRAWSTLASCMGLKSEIVESFQGVTINIMGEDDAEALRIEGRPASDAKPQTPPQRIQITK